MTTKELKKYTKHDFFEIGNALPPLMRLGYSDGPGAFITSEPYQLRQCVVTKKTDYGYDAFFVFNGPKY